jgi:UPF0271 protein
VATAPVIDLNADLGESYGSWRLGDDAALLPLLTSANVACGFHAGDPLTLRRTVAAAGRLGVVVGAQVSYPDLVGFGRREMAVAADELEADVLYQLAALDGLCRTEGTRVRYLKPHGALYHRTLKDPEQAHAVVAAVVAYGADLPVVTMAAGELAAAAAAAGLRVIREGFADRAYGPDGRLIPRGQPGAVLDDPDQAAAQALAVAASGLVDSICLHGDTPGAVAFARAVRERLEAAGATIRPFV